MIGEKVGFTIATSLARLFVSLETTNLDRLAIFISHPCIDQVLHHGHQRTFEPMIQRRHNVLLKTLPA